MALFHRKKQEKIPESPKEQQQTPKEATKEVRHYKILIRPIVSEKAAFIREGNKYIFQVRERANKMEIKRAIKTLYGVNPLKVNILNVKGKQVKYGRSTGRTKKWRKAIITLQKGEKIEIK